MAKYDNLGPLVTTAMALSGYPTGPVNEARIQRVAAAMLKFGILSPAIRRRGGAGHPGRVDGPPRVLRGLRVLRRPRVLKRPRAVRQQRIAASAGAEG